MAKLSMREAVRHFDVSRPTLTKALKSGKISGNQDGKGVWSIDPAELSRVYRPRSTEQNSLEHRLQANARQNLTTQYSLHAPELDDLRERLSQAELRATTAETRATAAETLAKERADRIEDLRRMLPPPEQPKKRRWWHLS